MSKVGHLPLFERVPAASVVRANLVSRVILIFRVNQATQLLFSTEFSYWAILFLLLFISLINIWNSRLAVSPSNTLDQPGQDLGTHSSISAWKIPWAKEPGGVQSVRSQRIGHEWTTEAQSTLLLGFGVEALASGTI